MVFEKNITTEDILTVSNLSKSYNDQLILDDISFSIKRGETLAIIGPSGVGKSTLLQCLNLLVPFDSGQLVINGKPVAQFNTLLQKFQVLTNPSEVRRKIGMVFQEWNLWPNKTVCENIIEAPILVSKKSKEEALKIANYFSEKVHLSYKLDSYPNELSGGEKQRAAIARALAMYPEILMLDEITSALDPYLVSEILEVIAALKKDGQTLLIVTHHINFARSISDRILFLCNGRIHESGNTKEILNDPLTIELQNFLSKIQKTY